MRRNNRRNSIKKERIIMIASSVFVLSALTMTGIYMKQNSLESKDDGYTIDFTAMENNASQKLEEIADNQLASGQTNNTVGTQTDGNNGSTPQISSMDDDLDYMPMEPGALEQDSTQVGSGLVEIPGLTDNTALSEEETPGQDEGTEKENESDAVQEPDAKATEGKAVVKELHFSEENGLTRPVSGEVLLPYSMNSSIYFATLDQYKYNPAVMFSAEEGTAVSACAEGKVVSVFENEEIGHALTLDLGDGYLVTYGQLQDIQVTVDSYVNAGETIAKVAAPTKYFSSEGCNLYFKLTKDDTSVNPENLFQ